MWRGALVLMALLVVGCGTPTAPAPHAGCWRDTVLAGPEGITITLRYHLVDCDDR